MPYCQILFLMCITLVLSSMDNNSDEQASKKRKLVSVACDPCRKRHQGCDNKLPCSRCIASGREHECIKRPRKRWQTKKGPINNFKSNPSLICYGQLAQDFCLGDVKIEPMEEKIAEQEGTYTTINFRTENNFASTNIKLIGDFSKDNFNSQNLKTSTRKKKKKWKAYHPPLIIDLQRPSLLLDSHHQQERNISAKEKLADREQVESRNAIPDCDALDKALTNHQVEKDFSLQTKNSNAPSVMPDFWDLSLGLDGLDYDSFDSVNSVILTNN